jgi:hypothetical protein
MLGVGSGVGIEGTDVVKGALAQAENINGHKILSFEF